MKHIAFLILTLIGQTQGIQYQSDYSSIWTGSYAQTTEVQIITFSQPFQMYHKFPQTLQSFLTLTKVRHIQGFYQLLTQSILQVLEYPQSKTFSHTNSRADTGIIILTSFLGSANLDFTLSLGVITSTTVEVNVYQENLASLGYIVIIGPSECFDIETQIVQLPLDQQDPNVYKSRQVTKETNTIWLFYFQYFAFQFPGSYRLQLEPTFTSTASEYKFSSWGDSVSKFTKFAHQCATLRFLPINSNAMLLQKVRISGLILKTQTENFDFSIVGIDFTYIPFLKIYNLQPFWLKLNAVKIIRLYHLSINAPLAQTIIKQLLDSVTIQKQHFNIIQLLIYRITIMNNI